MMCKKSRFGKNTAKTDAKCDTHRKQQKNGRHMSHSHGPAEIQMQVQAGMCNRSRVGENTVKTDVKGQSQRKKKATRNGEIRNFLYSVPRRLAHFFARKHHKNRCEKKTQNQFRVSKVPKLEF